MEDTTTLTGDIPEDEVAPTTSPVSDGRAAESHTTGRSQPDTTPIEASPVGNPPEGTEPLASRPDPTEEEDTDPIEALEREAPSFDKSTISLIIQLLPEDNHPDGRVVLLAAKSHNLTPKITTVRLKTITPLPDPIARLLEQWKDELPSAVDTRSAQRANAKAKAEQEQRERKEKAEAAKQRLKDEKKSGRAQTKPKTVTPAPTAETTSHREPSPSPKEEQAPLSPSTTDTEQAALF